MNTSQRGVIALKGDAEFRKVRQGRAVRTPFFMLRKIPYKPRPGQPYAPRAVVGIVASRKSLGNAVQRNRARRRVREALRLIQLPACRAVLLLNEAVLAVPFETLKTSLEAAFARPFK